MHSNSGGHIREKHGRQGDFMWRVMTFSWGLEDRITAVRKCLCTLLTWQQNIFQAPGLFSGKQQQQKWKEKKIIERTIINQLNFYHYLGAPKPHTPYTNTKKKEIKKNSTNVRGSPSLAKVLRVCGNNLTFFVDSIGIIVIKDILGPATDVYQTEHLDKSNKHRLKSRTKVERKHLMAAEAVLLTCWSFYTVEELLL